MMMMTTHGEERLTPLLQLPYTIKIPPPPPPSPPSLTHLGQQHYQSSADHPQNCEAPPPTPTHHTGSDGEKEEKGGD